jgi:hypothetical protein
MAFSEGVLRHHDNGSNSVVLEVEPVVEQSEEAVRCRWHRLVESPPLSLIEATGPGLCLDDPQPCRRMTGLPYRGKRTVEQGRCCTRSPRSRDDVNHVQPRRPARWWVILALHHSDDLVAFLGNKHGPVWPDDGGLPLVARPFLGLRIELTVNEEFLVAGPPGLQVCRSYRRRVLGCRRSPLHRSSMAHPVHWRRNFSVPPTAMSGDERQAP